MKFVHTVFMSYVIHLESVLCRALTIYNKTTKKLWTLQALTPSFEAQDVGMQLMAGILKAQMGGTT